MNWLSEQLYIKPTQPFYWRERHFTPPLVWSVKIINDCVKDWAKWLQKYRLLEITMNKAAMNKTAPINFILLRLQPFNNRVSLYLVYAYLTGESLFPLSNNAAVYCDNNAAERCRLLTHMMDGRRGFSQWAVTFLHLREIERFTFLPPFCCLYFIILFETVQSFECVATCCVFAVNAEQELLRNTLFCVGQASACFLVVVSDYNVDPSVCRCSSRRFSSTFLRRPRAPMTTSGWSFKPSLEYAQVGFPVIVKQKTAFFTSSINMLLPRVSHKPDTFRQNGVIAL